MARREDVMNTIWDDLDHLSNDAMLLYVWSWTNPRCGMSGLYKVPRRKLLEGRLQTSELAEALTELDKQGNLRYEEGVLWVVARVKRLSMISDQIAKSIAKDLAEIDPKNPLFGAFVSRYGGHPKLEALKSLTGGSGEGQRDVPIEPNGRTSGEGQPTLPGRGRGYGHGRGEVIKDAREDFSIYDSKTIVDRGPR